MLSILAFSLVFIPGVAFAEGGTNYVYSSNFGSYSNTYPNSYYNTYPSYYNNYVPAPQHQKQIVYVPVDGPTKTVYVNTSTTTDTTTDTTKTVAVNNTSNTTSNTDKINTATTSDTSKATSNNSRDTVSGLTSNAIFGTNSFYPSGIVQWVLVAIFILLLVILARRIFGARDEYQLSPLKHD